MSTADAHIESEQSQSFLWRVGLRARKFILRTQRGPLRPVWWLAHEILLRTVAAWLRRGSEAGVFVGGTFGRGEAVFGVSDIDLIVVAAGDEADRDRARLRVKERWTRLSGVCKPLSWLISSVYVYEQPELEKAVRTTCMTYGLDRSADGVAIPPAAFAGGHAPKDEGGLLVRPGLWPTREWRLLAGSDLRPAAVLADDHERRLAAWLELQFWWRFAFAACVEPAGRHVPYVCVKLVAEPVRIWLWLVRGEQLFARKEALARALELIPEEEQALRQALTLHDRLHRSPQPPLGDVLPFLVRFSSRIARRIADEIGDAGTVEVRLVSSPERPAGGSGESLEGGRVFPVGQAPRALPLVDWRARTRPQPREESFVLASGDPSDPDSLAAAALAAHADVVPALAGDGVLVFPTPPADTAPLRSVQCAATDPVSTALIEGRPAAAFPNVPGWSARDSALRAVAEHRAWLEEARSSTSVRNGHELPRDAAVTTLGQLFSAGRAAYLLESLDEGEPQLALSYAAVAECLGEFVPGARDLVEDAYFTYRDASRDSRQLPPRTLSALHELVRSLPSYSTRPRAIR